MEQTIQLPRKRYQTSRESYLSEADVKFFRMKLRAVDGKILTKEEIEHLKKELANGITIKQKFLVLDILELAQPISAYKDTLNTVIADQTQSFFIRSEAEDRYNELLDALKSINDN